MSLCFHHVRVDILFTGARFSAAVLHLSESSAEMENTLFAEVKTLSCGYTDKVDKDKMQTFIRLH